MEDFKVYHSKTTTKFVDNPQNPSNSLQDFLYKNSRFEKCSSFFRVVNFEVFSLCEFLMKIDFFINLFRI